MSLSKMKVGQKFIFKSHNKVFASIPKSEITEKSLKVGQEWVSPKGDKLRIIRKWSDLFITKDRFGDEKKMYPKDIVKKLKDEKFKLTKRKEIEHILTVLASLIAPYLSPLTASILIGAIRMFLNKKSL